ncbi:hypothetical protein OPT61_g4599 [Boeremia exigua]|uniref:Uncharacterized protein n=1 Tax=Boeremia exigua TaxID=749465 RepID=A0ACC2IDC6_9PLEO|nr:hypothetical protein OPT61_g4599 [Boeremia exigua]
MLTEQLSEPEELHQLESTHQLERSRQLERSNRDAVRSQPQSINQQQKDAQALVTPEVTPESPEVTQLTGQPLATCVNPTALAKLSGEAPKMRLHRDQLPAEPNRWKDLDQHPFGDEFKKASRKEVDHCVQRSCFSQTAEALEITEAEILPLMWVFTYKFNKDGYLYKFKARLAVRGDLQQDYGDTYAATLAAKIFRCLIALAAAFDLELYQYDVLNAFLNAELNRRTYVRCPEGYESELGQLLKLKRALYGLRDAPQLWYKHLTTTLEKLGLQQVPGVPCLFSNDHLIVFFFVDDIVVVVAPENKDTYRQFDQQLRAAYDIRFLGELKWFLGIRVIRDRSQKKIWLMQDSFINKVAAKYNIA